MSATDTTVGTRGRPLVYLGFLTAGLVALLLATAILVTYVAFDRQDSRLANLEVRDSQIVNDHEAIGERLLQLDRRTQEAVRLANGAYQRGVRTGRRVERLTLALPRPFRRLSDYAMRGFLVPRAIPRALRGAAVGVAENPSGYRISWSGVTIGASSRVRLSAWIRQGQGRPLVGFIGPRRVLRILAPYGTVYAFSERGRSYAVITGADDTLVRGIVRSMR